MTNVRTTEDAQVRSRGLGTHSPDSRAACSVSSSRVAVSMLVVMPELYGRAQFPLKTGSTGHQLSSGGIAQTCAAPRGWARHSVGRRGARLIMDSFFERVGRNSIAEVPPAGVTA